MNWAPIFATLFIGPVIAAGIIGGILQAAQRETTGNFERWVNQPNAQQQVLTDSVQNIPLDSNTSNRDDGALDPDGDHDGDTISNGDELAIGFDPRNPDSSGDGVDDRIAVQRGMTLEKTVNGGKRTNAKVGDEVEYKVQAKWYVLTDEPRTLTFLDPKPSGISILEGYYEFDSVRTRLFDWPVRLDFPVSGKGAYELVVVIKAQVAVCNGSIVNIATVSGAGTLNQGISDMATILVTPSPTRLLIDRLTKTANGEHWLETTDGASVDFHINAQVTFDTCAEERTVVVRDIASGGLEFVSGFVTFNNSSWPLTRIPSELTFKLDQSGVYTIDIRFVAKVTGPGIITNRAIIFEQEDPGNRNEDTVLITVSGANQPLVTHLLKQGRLEGTIPWGHYVFANNEDTVEFRIASEIGEGDAGLIDALPRGLLYVPNTLKLFFGGIDTNTPEIFLRRVFDAGIPLEKGPGKYELYFFVKVNAAAPFSLTNTASVLEGFLGGNPQPVATSESTVISK